MPCASTCSNAESLKERTFHLRNRGGRLMASKPHIDLEALYGALNAERENRGLSWRELGKEIGTSASTFTRLAQGRGTDADTFATLVAWLGVSADHFVRGNEPPKGQPRTVAAISSYLRAD